MTAGTVQRIAIVGGGPAGLMAAEVLGQHRAFDVTVYDAMPSLGRKFLMAGRGGLNLTHTEPMDTFLARYRERAHVLGPVLAAWTPDDVRQWCEGLGQETFVGSSGRVFPKLMKTSGLLRGWLQRLDQYGVAVRTRHRWLGWEPDGRLRFATPEGPLAIKADATLLALGGGSWARLGSDGAWVTELTAAGIDVAPLLPSNVGVAVPWSDVFRARFEGEPLKRIALSFGGRVSRGEVVITAQGIEGGAVYALTAVLRDHLQTSGHAELQVDLKPDMPVDAVAEQLKRARGKQSMATFLRKTARLSPIAIGLLQECAMGRGVRIGDLQADELAALVKAVALPVTGVGATDKAISTAGGVRFDGLDARFMLARKPGVFVAGEMLDWEAPTGGYLLQACFATGVAAGQGIAEWLAEQDPAASD